MTRHARIQDALGSVIGGLGRPAAAGPGGSAATGLGSIAQAIGRRRAARAAKRAAASGAAAAPVAICRPALRLPPLAYSSVTATPGWYDDPARIVRFLVENGFPMLTLVLEHVVLFEPEPQDGRVFYLKGIDRAIATPSLAKVRALLVAALRQQIHVQIVVHLDGPSLSWRAFLAYDPMETPLTKNRWSIQPDEAEWFGEGLTPISGTYHDGIVLPLVRMIDGVRKEAPWPAGCPPPTISLTLGGECELSLVRHAPGWKAMLDAVRVRPTQVLAPEGETRPALRIGHKVTENLLADLGKWVDRARKTPGGAGFSTESALAGMASYLAALDHVSVSFYPNLTLYGLDEAAWKGAAEPPAEKLIETFRGAHAAAEGPLRDKLGLPPEAIDIGEAGIGWIRPWAPNDDIPDTEDEVRKDSDVYTRMRRRYFRGLLAWLEQDSEARRAAPGSPLPFRPVSLWTNHWQFDVLGLHLRLAEKAKGREWLDDAKLKRELFVDAEVRAMLRAYNRTRDDDDRVRGAILLGAWGDALGAPHEPAGLAGETLKEKDLPRVEALQKVDDAIPESRANDEWAVWPPYDLVKDRRGMVTDDTAVRVTQLEPWLSRVEEGAFEFSEADLLRWFEEERKNAPTGVPWLDHHVAAQMDEWLAAHEHRTSKRAFYRHGEPVALGLFLYLEAASAFADCSAPHVFGTFATLAKGDQLYGGIVTGLLATLLARAMRHEEDRTRPERFASWFLREAKAILRSRKIRREPRVQALPDSRGHVKDVLRWLRRSWRLGLERRRRGREAAFLVASKYAFWPEKNTAGVPYAAPHARSGLYKFDPLLFLLQMTAALSFARDPVKALRLLAGGVGDADTVPSFLGLVVGAWMGDAALRRAYPPLIEEFDRHLLDNLRTFFDFDLDATTVLYRRLGARIGCSKLPSKVP